MKIRLRAGLPLLAIGFAGLLAGCATQHSAQARRKAVLDYSVVETSMQRAMTPLEEAELRVAVLRYLEKRRGVVEQPRVKFYLPTEEDGATPEWVVVQFSENIGVRYEGVAAYPRYYWQTGPYYAYDYYPWGYDSFGRFSIYYYDDWIYSHGWYYPRNPHRRHDHEDDRVHGRPRPPEGSRAESHPFKPIPPVPAERTRWRRPPPPENNPTGQRDENLRPEQSERQQPDGPRERPEPPRFKPIPRMSAPEQRPPAPRPPHIPPPESRYTPPPEYRRPEPAPRYEPPPRERNDAGERHSNRPQEEMR